MGIEICSFHFRGPLQMRLPLFPCEVAWSPPRQTDTSGTSPRSGLGFAQKKGRRSCCSGEPRGLHGWPKDCSLLPREKNQGIWKPLRTGWLPAQTLRDGIWPLASLELLKSPDISKGDVRRLGSQRLQRCRDSAAGQGDFPPPTRLPRIAFRNRRRPGGARLPRNCLRCPLRSPAPWAASMLGLRGLPGHCFTTIRWKWDKAAASRST